MHFSISDEKDNYTALLTPGINVVNSFDVFIGKQSVVCEVVFTATGAHKATTPISKITPHHQSLEICAQLP